MTEREFCYWLKGYFELSGSDIELTSTQVKVIEDHLKLVFKKETPDRFRFINHPLADNDNPFNPLVRYNTPVASC